MVRRILTHALNCSIVIALVYIPNRTNYIVLNHTNKFNIAIMHLQQPIVRAGIKTNYMLFIDLL